MIIQPREYQLNVFKNSIDQNTLIVMPTGLGKTVIAAMLIEKFYNEKKKSLMMAPTKPLVLQHAKTIAESTGISENEIGVFTGEIDAEERDVIWVTRRVFVSTPQVVFNDMRSGILDITKFDLLIFDEAHRAVGNYAYVDIAQEYLKYKKKLIIGLTASPGGDREKIDEIITNLGIAKVIAKTEYDEDVRKYVKTIDVKLVRIPEPESTREILSVIDSIMTKLLEPLKDNGFRVGRSRKDLVAAMQKVIDSAKEDRSLFQLVRRLTAAIRLDYLREYIETQGLDVAMHYLDEMKRSEDSSIRRAMSILSGLEEFGDLERKMTSYAAEYINPKMQRVVSILSAHLHGNARAIVFTHYRITSDILMEYLHRNAPDLKPVRFIGQADRGADQGLSQDQQRKIIDDFKNNVYNVLIATSIAEEGLDIPDTDFVIFYEAVPSEIRYIQRKGRTGRSRNGQVYILVFENSRDMAYYYSSIRKVSRMSQVIEDMKQDSEENKKQEKQDAQTRLFDF
ncbi:DEAD/DEAH box helicase family protein [Thermoplasma sp.]|uniref:DEAD/DEAH box helicase family protein n=1 Tax=Thermoplasma sp. TaxID=1973142 RepID=UPI00260E34E3|nr:DEAD/DEAH box helicase family protein [Thermoplasma sp.]